VGDELMALPILTEIKRRNPGCHITFFSFHPGLFRGHPAIDVIEPRTFENPDPPSLRLAYDYLLPPPRPLMQLMGESIGFSMTFDQLERPPVPLPADPGEHLRGLPRPWFVIQTRSSGWTSNKDWPIESWDALVKGLAEIGSVIEVGTKMPLPASDYGENFVSLVGGTSVEEFAHIVSAADLFVGPISGGMHLADAFGVPAVIIVGGYEEPSGHPYKRMSFLYTAVECAPCWARTCSFGLKCLRAITPAAVLAEVKLRLAE
jgi:ADP-heptose:LPS heptosyltransferase